MSRLCLCACHYTWPRCHSSCAGCQDEKILAKKGRSMTPRELEALERRLLACGPVRELSVARDAIRDLVREIRDSWWARDAALKRVAEMESRLLGPAPAETKETAE